MFLLALSFGGTNGFMAGLPISPSAAGGVAAATLIRRVLPLLPAFGGGGGAPGASPAGYSCLAAPEAPGQPPPSVPTPHPQYNIIMKNYGPGLPKCHKCKNIYTHILHTFQGVYSPTFTPNSLQKLVHILIQVLSSPKPKSHACNNGSPPNKQTKKHFKTYRIGLERWLVTLFQRLSCHFEHCPVLDVLQTEPFKPCDHVSWTPCLCCSARLSLQLPEFRPLAVLSFVGGSFGHISWFCPAPFIYNFWVG